MSKVPKNEAEFYRPLYADGGVVPDSEVVLESAPVSSVNGSDVVPDSEVNFSPVDQSSPEAIADAASAKDEAIDAKHGKLGEAKAFLEGAAETGTFGLSTKAETALGISTPEKIRERREELPIAHGAGQIAGLLIPGAPEVKALGMAGKAASGLVRGSGFLSKVGRGAVKGAVENALFQTGDEVSKKFVEDPNQTAQTALTDITLSGLLGGGLGGAFGAVHPLWDKAKSGKFVNDMKSRFNEHLTDPNLATKPADELAKFHSETTQGSNDLYKGSYDESGARLAGVKEQALDKLVPEMNPKIADEGVGKVTNNVLNKLEEMKADTDTYSPKFTKYLESDFNKWQEVANNPEASSRDIFRATEDLKRTLQSRSKIGIPIDSTNPAYDSVKSFKKLASDLRKGLEDTEVWGEAGKFQKETNEAFTKFQQPLKDFNRSFATKIGDNHVVDPDKVQTYLNLASKEKGAIRGEKLQNYLDAASKYRDAINEAHSKIGVEGPFEHVSGESVNPLGKLSSGAKAADAVVKNILEHSASEGAGAIGGALFGWPGYMVGKHVGGPLLDKVIPKLIKPVLGSAAEGTAFKNGLDYVAAFAKGETRLNKGVSNLFKAGKEVLPSHLIPDEKDILKLDKRLKDLAVDPTPMTEVGGKTAHYLPDHGQALAQTAMSAVNYLNSQRPYAPKVSPLDSKSEVNPMQKAQFNRVLKVAQQPLVVLNHIKEGTLQPKDVEAIRNLYPDLYNSLSTKIITQVSSRKDTDEPIPYKTKMGMSLFLGKPLDSTMIPEAIIAAQPVPQQQPQQQPSGKKPTESSAKAMNKVSQAAMTPTQARSAERAGMKA